MLLQENRVAKVAIISGITKKFFIKIEKPHQKPLRIVVHTCGGKVTRKSQE